MNFLSYWFGAPTLADLNKESEGLREAVKQSRDVRERSEETAQQSMKASSRAEQIATEALVQLRINSSLTRIAKVLGDGQSDK